MFERLISVFRNDDGSLLVPPWVPIVFWACAIVLVPWTAYLFVSLPGGYQANHWRLAWGGFDVGLAGALVFTAAAVHRRSPVAEIAATITGTLLVCDAWFDVLTSRGTSDIVQAALDAVLELGLAALCFWIARNLDRAIETAAPWLRDHGFTVRGHRLVPPDESA